MAAPDGSLCHDACLFQRRIGLGSKAVLVANANLRCLQLTTIVLQTEGEVRRLSLCCALLAQLRRLRGRDSRLREIVLSLALLASGSAAF